MVANTASPNLPDITVQIVHIEGPRKGQIDEFSQPVITIGRNPSSDVPFPKDFLIVSRKHAEIKREGNRFLLINHGRNGTFVNGQSCDTTYLKQGDVVTFAEGGPKVSFLYTVGAQPQARRATPPPPPSPPPPPPRAHPSPPPPPPPPRPSVSGASGSRPAPKPPPGPAEVAPVTIQYGTSIRSFKQASVKLGKDRGSDFVVEHPRVFGTHAEIYFQRGQYHLRDLTESHATLLNGRPIATDTPLQDNDTLTLSEGGPKLKYLGTGRFAEVIE